MHRCEGRRLALGGRQHCCFPEAVEAATSPGSKQRGMRVGGFLGNPGGLVVSILKTAGGRAPAHQARGRGCSTWRPTERKCRCSDGISRAKATKRGEMGGEESERLIVPVKRGNRANETPWREGGADRWTR